MDDREAARRYKLAADQGDALAQVSLGMFYETGRGGLLQDDREAARLYKLAADQGNASAQVRLGLFYENGRADLPADDREAVRLYKLAADQGNATGQATLGVFYESGRGGLPKDDNEAARLYKLAADQGNAAGQAYLGIFSSRVVVVCRRTTARPRASISLPQSREMYTRKPVLDDWHIRSSAKARRSASSVRGGSRPPAGQLGLTDR